MKKNYRLKIVLILFVIYGIVYMILNTMYYEKAAMRQEVINTNEELENEIDLLDVDINTLNARDKIIKENPDLDLRENVYYLEDDE